MFRSITTRTGRWWVCIALPPPESLPRISVGCSEISLLSFLATISGAPPRGQRMTGTAPSVATTLNSPPAMPSMALSMSSPVALGLLYST